MSNLPVASVRPRCFPKFVSLLQAFFVKTLDCVVAVAELCNFRVIRAMFFLASPQSRPVLYVLMLVSDGQYICFYQRNRFFHR
jgi:hypothetical protein